MKRNDETRLIRELIQKCLQQKNPLWRYGGMLLIVILVVVYLRYSTATPSVGPENPSSETLPRTASSEQEPPARSGSNAKSEKHPSESDRVIVDAFKKRRSNLIVEGQGTIIKNLPDDNIGDRHQKFIVKLASGHTIQIAHNIDLASRIPAKEGEMIAFRGEFEYSEKGGVIHWTHHDPAGRHENGWIRHRGKNYE